MILEDSAIPLLGIYPKVAPTSNKNTFSTMFIASLFIIARSLKEPKHPSTEEWIQKLWYIYTVGCYSAIKNNEFIKFLGKWMKLEAIILSEVAQSQKNTHGMHSLISRNHPPQKNKAQNTQETIHRTYEAQKEGRPKRGCLSPF